MFKRALLASLTVLVALTLAAVSPDGASTQGTPTLSTDKEDYYSNELVTVTGTGFAPNTSYDIPIIRPNGSIVHGDGSFTPGWDTVTSNGSGEFTYYYQLNGIYGTYTIETYVSPWGGPGSGDPLIATFTFTDADIDFSQCRNDSDNNNVKDDCDWSTGAINSTNSVYTEGEGVPQRLFHRVDATGTYSFVLEYDFSKDNAYSYDFLTSVDVTQSGALLAQCEDRPGFITLTQCNSMYGTNFQLAPITSDLFDGVAPRENPPVGRNFRVGCTPACAVGVSVVFPDPAVGPTDGEVGEAHSPDSDPDCFKTCGTSSVFVTVSVTTISASTRVGLWFAGHLAEAANPVGTAIGWGTGCAGNLTCGASAISGAPFHLKYSCQQFNGGTCDSVGNRDNQMQIGAVLPPGLIQISKNATPDGPQDFSFTGSLGGFSLDDDADSTLPSSETFVDVTPGSYSVTETLVPGWSLSGITCTDPDGGTTINLGTATATIDLDTGENISCTYNNTFNAATFTVSKDFVPNSAGDVNVSLSCTSGTVASVDGTASESDPADFNVTGYSGSPTCTATESAIPTGYSSSGTCAAPLSGGSCTITNTLNTGTLTVNKDFSDNTATDVTVSVTCSSGTVLNDDPTASEADPANFTINGFSTGATCTATETVPGGYSANQANCVNVALTIGGNATCTIVNNALGTIVVQKTTNPAGSAQSFSVNLTGPVNTSGSVTDATDQFFIDLPPGSYNLTETLPANWQQTGASCSDSSPLNAISLSFGETVTCVFSNETVDTFNVQKDFVPDLPLGSVNVSLSCASGSVTANDGTASESDDANFTVTGFTGDPTCTATESGVPLGYNSSNCAASLSAGGCTIVNSITSGSFNVNKDFVPNNGGTVSVTLSCASGVAVPTDPTAAEADDANFGVTGFTGDPLCTATETLIPAGYDSTGTCAALLSAGSCTILNTLRTAQVVVNKDFSDDNPTDVTVAILCTSGSVANDDTTASEADPANFTVTGFDAGATCTATETPPVGYTPSQFSCAGIALTHNGTASCTITNVLNAASFNVNKDFVPDDGATVTVTLSCASGASVPTDPTAAEADDANFAVTGYTGDPLCTATETLVPTGYSSSGTCSAALSAGSCTIVNTLNTATLIVNKDFSDNSAADVTVSVTCSTGTVVNDDATASEADPANFTINGFTPPANCTATEAVPGGYTANQSNCANVAISIGGTSSCTIVNDLLGTIVVQKTTNPAGSAQSFAVNLTGPVNASGSVTDATDQFFIDLPAGSYTLTETLPPNWQMTGASCSDGSPLNAIALSIGETVTCVFSNETVDTFNVIKDFLPDNASDVNVTLSCASGLVTTNDGTASEADDANFTVTGFTGDPLCTANETGVPAGYTTNSCSALLSLGSCTIINAQTSSNFNVNKDFVPNAGGTVLVTLSCASGVAVPGDPDASEADDANFSVLGFTGDPLCTATETLVPAGYDSTGTCSALLSAGSCTIVNTLRTAQVVVSKDFTDDNPADVTVSILCTSGIVANDDTTASESDAANFTVTGFDLGATCIATESVPGGYVPNQLACATLMLTHNGTASCTITNTPTTATFNVNKNFVPNAGGSVLVVVTCASGVAVPTDPDASEADDANFTVTGFIGDPNCTATEAPVPAGYESTGTCSAPLSAGACTIVNTLRTAQVVVSKDFSDDNPANVTISLLCSSGAVANDDTTASESDPANFTVTGFDAGASCVATETVPGGYTANQVPCATLTLTHTGTATCTITNTPTTATFNVNKDFVPDAGGTVTVTLSCASGVAVPTDPTASEADDANFTVTGFSGDPNCTATETLVPAGYDSSGTCSAVLSSGLCTIVNTLRTAQVVVNKDFSDNNAADVTIAVICTSGAVANDDTTASEADPANFTVTGFNAGATCTATEVVPVGYTPNQVPCATLAITHPLTATCTITNTLVTAPFTVNKDFSDNNPADVIISLSCASGVAVPTDPTASESDPADFTVSGFSGNPQCTATESGVPSGYTISGCQANLNTGACTIVNNAIATFTVNKDFTDGNTASVTVTLSCSSGSVAPPSALASEATPATFTVTGYGPGAQSCTATESPVPAGYTWSGPCTGPITNHAGSCTIVNQPAFVGGIVPFYVYKDFTDGNTADVVVTLSCSPGNVLVVIDNTASEADVAEFSVDSQPTTTCTASEQVPPGYVADASDCVNVPVGDLSCTIVNTPGTPPVGGFVDLVVPGDNGSRAGCCDALIAIMAAVFAAAITCGTTGLVLRRL